MGIDANMFVRVKGKVTESQLIAAEHTLFERFGAEMLSTWTEHLLEEVDEVAQDGPTVTPRKGEAFINVNLWTRYYGPGYERGNIRLIIDVAEVLETIFVGGEVWYGGDSSGVCAVRFNAAARAELRDHWLKVGHEPYRRGKNQFMPEPDTDDGPDCRRCKVPTHRYGWGGNYAAYFCECGERIEIRNGITKTTSQKEREDRRHALERKALEFLGEADRRELGDLWSER